MEAVLVQNRANIDSYHQQKDETCQHHEKSY